MFHLRFMVSRLSYVIDHKTDRLEVVVLDRKTGHPMEGVSVIAQRRNWEYKSRKYITTTLATVKSDRNGKAVFDQKIGTESFQIALRNGDDVLLPQGYNYIPRQNESTLSHNTTQLFTDRAIYRPGQTIHFKGIVVHHERDDQALAVNFNETVTLRDANWQEVTRASFARNCKIPCLFSAISIK